MARSEVNYIYDAEMAFRAPGSAAVTADGVIGAKPLDKMDKVRPGFRRNKLGAEGYKVVFAVEELATAGGDEVYTFAVEVGPEGAAATKVGEITVGETGQYVLALDAHTIEKMDADHEEIELNIDVTGVAPSIKFAAWIV
jgi:hypothetical protein